MRALWLIGLLAWTSLLLVPEVVPTTLRRVPGLAATLRRLVPEVAATTLRLEVMDGQGVPVVQLALRVEDADGQPYDIRTNADGQAVAGPLEGPVSYIRQATLADGQALQVEPTTPTEGLRLGLIPGHERTVRLIADGGLLFLDPEELFPADDPAPPAPSDMPLPSSSRALDTVLRSTAGEPTTNGEPASSRSGAAAAPTTAAASVEPFITGAPSRVRLIGLVAVVASTIVVLIGIIVVRRQA